MYRCRTVCGGEQTCRTVCGGEQTCIGVGQYVAVDRHV